MCRRQLLTAGKSHSCDNDLGERNIVSVFETIAPSESSFLFDQGFSAHKEVNTESAFGFT